MPSTARGSSGGWTDITRVWSTCGVRRRMATELREQGLTRSKTVIVLVILMHCLRFCLTTGRSMLSTNTTIDATLKRLGQLRILPAVSIATVAAIPCSSPLQPPNEMATLLFVPRHSRRLRQTTVRTHRRIRTITQLTQRDLRKISRIFFVGMNGSFDWNVVLVFLHNVNVFFKYCLAREWVDCCGCVTLLALLGRLVAKS
mmetsp:Transcript_40799/g.85511  ORF Transcript_40799/g.85511 Transcript_40799/m.85511 type:complete len:201 (-) Transcript_40799:240-842(-)